MNEMGTDELTALRRRLRTILDRRPDLTMAHLASLTTLSDCVVRNFMSGNLRGGYQVHEELARLANGIEAGDICVPGNGDVRVISDETQARVRRVKRQGTFYQTATVNAVFEVLDYCVERSAIGVITGDFGVGKTASIGAWRRANPHVDTAVTEFDAFTAQDRAEFVARLAAQLGATPSSGRAGRIFQAIVEHLCEHPCVLIMDQAEMAHPRVLQVVRQIWDRTSEYGVSVVLLAAPLLMHKLMVSRIADLGALTSRVGVWATLNGVSRQEMAAIVKQEGITDVDDSAFEMWWRSTGGSMRRLMRAIDLLKAKHAGKKVTEKTIAQMSRHLWGQTLRAE